MTTTDSRPRVTLPQGTLVGTVLTKDLPQPIDAFLGVPYAKPPVGDLRFRRALPVDPSDEVIDASKFGPAAPAKQLFNKPGQKLTYSEDCLTANIFRVNQGSKSDKDSKDSNNKHNVPVALYIHGGAFNRGTSSMYKAHSLVAHSATPLVAVTFNYRIGALGFLPSALSKEEGILNLGLHDQILLLEWVQDNIAAFGGDPDQVTLYGLSAGGHSVGHHLLHLEKEGDDIKKPLFHRVLLESGAPTSRAVRPYDAPIHEQQFRDFLQEVGYPEEKLSQISSSSVFPFLRNLPSETITKAQTRVFDKYNPSLRWAFQPVIDGDLIARPPLTSWKQGLWHRVPLMTGFNGNEGSLYVDQDMDRPQDFVHFFRELLPLLTEDDLAQVDALYPDPSKVPDSAYRETRPGLGSQYKRIEAAYGQYAYVAPTRQTAHLASGGSPDDASTSVHHHHDLPPSYLYHWALITSVVGGARHGDNVAYETCDPDVLVLSPAQKELAGTVNAYITSFIATGDPNAIPGHYPERPIWEPYNPETPKALLFGAGNEERIGGDVGIAAQFGDDTWARKECEFWWSKVDVSQQ